MMKSLVLMDFDGTLYKKDSLLEFTKFCKGRSRFVTGLLWISPILLSMKLKLVSNETAKKRYFAHFFKAMDYGLFLRQAKEFSLTRIARDLDPGVFETLGRHLANGDTVYIVTASMSAWIEDWARDYPIRIISTEPEIAENKITGNFATKNCNGAEKVNRILKEINLEDFTNIYVYGNGSGDAEMHKLAR